jgi:hypothetical protein
MNQTTWNRAALNRAINQANVHDGDWSLLNELLEVAEGLKKRCDAGRQTDNTELMQRARRLLDV